MRFRMAISWIVTLVLLAPAGFLTVVRATDPSAGPLIRAESFTPLALPAYAVVLVGALLVIATRRLRRRADAGGRSRRRVPVLVALVACAGLIVHAAWFSARVSGPNPPPADGAATLVVMTANLYVGRADGIELVRTASREGADVLVVEEVTTGELTSMEAAGLADLFPYRIGAADPADADGTMVFSRTELGAATPVATGHESWLVDVDAPGGDPLTLLAVHPYAPTELTQWDADHAAIRAAAREAEPDLIVGDFNATLDHPPMRELGALGWHSAAELANEGWQPTWPSGGVVSVLGVPVPSLVQIDHVLVGPRIAALGTHTIVLPGTDHRALVAEVARK